MELDDFKHLTLHLSRLTTKPVVVASHPRSGTHLLIDTIRRHFADCRGWKWPFEHSARLYLSLESIENPDAPLVTSTSKALALLQRAPRQLIKTHAEFPDFLHVPCERVPALTQPWKDWLNANATFIYVYRDGRDVLCSLHLFQQMYFAKARTSFSTFMRRPNTGGVTPAEGWAQHVRAWLKQPDCLKLKFRDIVKDTRSVISELGSALQLTPGEIQPLLPPKRAGIWSARLDRIIRVSPPTTAVLGRFQGKAPVKWREVMTAEDRQLFDEQTDGLLYQLGYESDKSWTSS